MLDLLINLLLAIGIGIAGIILFLVFFTFASLITGFISSLFDAIDKKDE